MNKSKKQTQKKEESRLEIKESQQIPIADIYKLLLDARRKISDAGEPDKSKSKEGQETINWHKLAQAYSQYKQPPPPTMTDVIDELNHITKIGQSGAETTQRINDLIPHLKKVINVVLRGKIENKELKEYNKIILSLKTKTDKDLKELQKWKNEIEQKNYRPASKIINEYIRCK